MPGLLLVEGLPGAGKSTLAHSLAEWLTAQRAPAGYWPEGRPDHPVDFEQVAALDVATFDALCERFPDWEAPLRAATTAEGDVLVVKHGTVPGLPGAVAAELSAFDVYDGPITAGLHSRLLTESWRRFGEAPPPAEIQVWECVLIQNPVCALIARLDESPAVLEQHVRGLVDAVSSHAPALVYLDTGDPLPALERVAGSRPSEWLEFVIGYHTEQGFGLRQGLSGFDGYVEFMRHRRRVELELLPRLALPTLVLPATPDTWASTTEAARAFAAEHVRTPS